MLAASNEKSPPESQTTEREKGVFAFFSLGAGPPDFENWIISSEEYAKRSKKEREEHLIRESIRLGTGYGQFEPQKTLLHIEANVLVNYEPPKDGSPAHVYFHFPKQAANYVPTFSYPYIHDEWISLVVNKLALFSKMPLTEDHYQAVLQHMRYPNEEYEGFLTIEVRAIKADHDKPIKNGPITQWILVGEIAYMKCEVESDLTGYRQQLWDYVAPWHEETLRLQNLPEDMKYPHPFDIKK